MELPPQKLDIRDVVKGAVEAREEWLAALNDIRDPAKRAEVKELIDRFTSDTNKFVEEYYRSLDQMADRYQQQQAATAEAYALLAQAESFEPPPPPTVAAPPPYDPVFGADLRESLLLWYRPPEPPSHTILQRHAFSEWAMETDAYHAAHGPFAAGLVQGPPGTEPAAEPSTPAAAGPPPAANAAISAGWTTWLRVEQAELTAGTAALPPAGSAQGGLSPLQSMVIAGGNVSPTNPPAGWQTWMESPVQNPPDRVSAPALSPLLSMVITTGTPTSGSTGSATRGGAKFGWNTWMGGHAASVPRERERVSLEAENPEGKTTWDDLLQ